MITVSAPTPDTAYGPEETYDAASEPYCDLPWPGPDWSFVQFSWLSMAQFGPRPSGHMGIRPGNELYGAYWEFGRPRHSFNEHLERKIDPEIAVPEVGDLVYSMGWVLLGRIIDIKDHSDATRYFWITRWFT